MCTNLSDNRFSCGLTQYCLGEYRLERIVLIRARNTYLHRELSGFSRKILRSLEMIHTVSAFAVLQFARPCSMAAALVHSRVKRNALGLRLPAQWLPGCTQLGSVAVAVGTTQQFYFHILTLSLGNSFHMTAHQSRGPQHILHLLVGAKPFDWSVK